MQRPQAQCGIQREPRPLRRRRSSRRVGEPPPHRPLGNTQALRDQRYLLPRSGPRFASPTSRRHATPAGPSPPCRSPSTITPPTTVNGLDQCRGAQISTPADTLAAEPAVTEHVRFRERGVGRDCDSPAFLTVSENLEQQLRAGPITPIDAPASRPAGGTRRAAGPPAPGGAKQGPRTGSVLTNSSMTVEPYLSALEHHPSEATMPVAAAATQVTGWAETRDKGASVRLNPRKGPTGCGGSVPAPG